MSEDNNLEKFNCSSCGIAYGLDKDVVKLWKNNHKQFWCPNGHSLAWSGKDDQEKLEEENKSLKEKNSALEATITEQKKKIEEIQSELEIWKPNERK